MAKLQHKHAGIVLAAGASSRMGQPKALLPTPDQIPLATQQANKLLRAGIHDVVIVLGCDAEVIRTGLHTSRARIIVNAAWRDGRLSSLQAGLRTLNDYGGVVILPVDTPGIADATLARLLARADGSSAACIRPQIHRQPGHLAWINADTAHALMTLPARDGFRLNDWLKPREEILHVDDPAILNNINTPDEWRRHLAGGRGI